MASVDRPEDSGSAPPDRDAFRSLIRRNPFGMYLVDADFRLSEISIGAQKVFSTVRPLLGRDFEEVLRILWPEPFVSHAIARFRHTLATGEPYSAPSTVEARADIGDVEAYDWQIERLSLPDGTFGVMCYFYDLSERQSWEKALREGERRLRLATDVAQLGIWSWDPEHDDVRWENERPYEVLGISRDEPPINAARFVREFLHGDDVAAFEAALRHSIEEEAPFGFEGRIRRPDGTVRWIEFTGAWERENEAAALRLIGTLRDITARKEAEEQLRESEMRFRIALKNAPIVVYSTDAELRYTWIYNPHPSFTPADVIGRRDEDLLPPDDAERIGRHKREVLRTGVGKRVEMSVALQGKTVVYDVTIEPLRDGSGAIAGITVSSTEITERKAAEERLHALAAELSHADRRKNEFLATLSHELRNPLAPITNAIDLLRLAGDDRALSERAVATIERQVRHLVRLIEDLLDISRITNDKLELKAERVELEPILRQAVETCRGDLTKAGHELIIRLEPGPIVLQADPQRLAQVFANLLNNAAKYTEPGGRIEISAARDDGQLEVTVRDSGIGIPADMLTRIFDMFSQVEGARSRSLGGLGIGLSLVRRLVRMHGGTVSAHSDGEGRGSAFVVRLPLLQE